MLQDLKERSAEFESESQSSRRGHGGKSGTGKTGSLGSDTGLGPLRYEDSLTMRRQDVTGADSMDYESSHPMPIYTPGQSNPAYAAQYPSDPAMYPYGNPSHQSNSYANPYTTTYASNTGIPAYTDNRAFPSDYPYQGPREGLQGQQYGYSQGYGEMPPRRPDPGYPGYMDPTRPSIPGQGQPYTIPNQPPRMFDDPNAPGYPYPRSTNQPFSSQYPPPGGAGPAQYGDNSRDTRDGRQREQPRDSYDRPSDYRSGRR